MTEKTLKIEEIEKEKDTDKRVLLYDQRAEERTKNIFKTTRPRKGKRRRRKTKCMWPGCENNAVSLNMCTNCRTKHYNGKLLTADSHAFNKEEMLELYDDVIEFAENVNITVEEAVTWLIAEGLNSYEKRIKEKGETEND